MLRDTDAKEWMKQDINNPNSRSANSVIKIDTIKTAANFSIIYHKKIPFTFNNRKKFSEIKADTVISSFDGFSSIMKVDVKQFTLIKFFLHHSNGNLFSSSG